MLFRYEATIDKASRKCVMIAAASRALFEASDVCVELPNEALADGDTSADTVEELKASPNSTSDASTNWQDELSG